MSVCASRTAACACSACARPISPPSIVTAALFDMFCGLKGSTRCPRRVAARASPATMSDLPTSEPAPWIINARATRSALELDAGLGLDARPERMFHQRHLRDEVGCVDQFLLGVAASEHDMHHRRLRVFQERDNLVDVKIVVAQSDVDLVEHDHAQARIGDQLLGLFPAALGSRDVAGTVLGFPGKTLAHGMELAEFTEMRGQKPALAGIPRAFDELHHRAGKTMRDASQDHAEGGGGFSLAGAGVNDDQSLLAALFGHHPVASGFLLGHFGCMAGVLADILFGNHSRHSFGLTSTELGQMVDCVGSCPTTGEEGMR